MLSTRPPNSKSSRPFCKPLVTVPKAPITIGIIVTFVFNSFCNSLTRSRYLSFFHILSVLFCDQPGQKRRQFCKFSFFVVDYYKALSSGRDSVIRLYVKVPWEFMCYFLGLLLLLLFHLPSNKDVTKTRALSSQECEMRPN